MQIIIIFREPNKTIPWVQKLALLVTRHNMLCHIMIFPFVQYQCVAVYKTLIKPKRI